MKNKYIILAIVVFSFSCETEDVAPISPNNPIDPTAIIGCTDPNAVNYNSNANADNGCCQYNSLLLNEVLYDPSNSGLEGDANGDGEYVHNEDEFVELVNVSNSNLDINLGPKRVVPLSIISERFPSVLSILIKHLEIYQEQLLKQQ